MTRGWLWRLVLLLCVSLIQTQCGFRALTGPQVRQLEQLIAEDPGAALTLAHTWQQEGRSIPDALLRRAVTAAFQPDAPREQVEAAIRAFDLYKNRPWAWQVMEPFLTRQAPTILLNAERFARLHPEWTKKVVEHTAVRAPSLVLSELPRLAVLDAGWAKTLAQRITASTPALAFSHAQELLAMDRSWAQKLLQEAAQAFPQAAVRGVQSYLAEPWGPQLFATAVLREPQWVVGIAAVPEEGQAVLKALRQAEAPPLRLLSQIASSPYPRETKVRLAVFVHDIVSGRHSLAEAARLSGDNSAYFRTLVAMQLAQPTDAVVGAALKDQALTLIEPINTQFDRPAAVRFRAVVSFTAKELYTLLVYTETEIFTSSYRGLFERLLARLHQEKLTGDQLLAQVGYHRFLVFIRLAASFNRLDQFLAAIPSDAARGALLTRCLQDMERPTPEVMAQALTATEVLATRLDPQSLRLMRDVIGREYHRAEQTHNRHAMAVYGLLAAQIHQQATPALRTPALAAVAARYQAALPDLARLPAAKLFPDGKHMQRHFFYNDDDGRQSFASFLAHYHHDQAWRIKADDLYVQITTQRTGKRMEIYANRPTEEATGLVDPLQHVFQKRQPEVIVHRGHSTHVDGTIAQLPATAVLIFLGNCGSYTQLGAALNKAPQAHIITTKGIGTAAINDPLLKALNLYLLRGKDVVWAEFWAGVTPKLAKNPRFEDYLPPDKNLSVRFLQAYHAVMATPRIASR